MKTKMTRSKVLQTAGAQINRLVEAGLTRDQAEEVVFGIIGGLTTIEVIPDPPVGAFIDGKMIKYGEGGSAIDVALIMNYPGSRAVAERMVRNCGLEGGGDIAGGIKYGGHGVHNPPTKSGNYACITKRPPERHKTWEIHYFNTIDGWDTNPLYIISWFTLPII